jgi:hypothetical protein
MRDRFLNSMATSVIAAVAAGTVVVSLPKHASADGLSVTSLKTPWGEPDLQGIWTAEFDVPLQRPAKYAAQEFFTEAQRAELDKERAMLVEKRQKRRTGVGDADVTGGLLLNPTGTRTSLIVDPRDGWIPPLTPEAQKANIYAETDLATKKRALATLARGKTRRATGGWSRQPDLMEFLRAL